MKRIKFIGKTAILLLATVFIASSCSSPSGNKDNSKSADTTVTQEGIPNSKAESADGKLNDAQIASAMIVANKYDISIAKMAKKNITSPKIVEVAQTMITDHQDLLDSVNAMVKALNVTPNNDNPITKNLLNGKSMTLENLANAPKGIQYDEAYMFHELKLHDGLISIMKQKVIPDAKNPQLKELLGEALTLFEKHLEMIKIAKTELDKK